MARCHLLTEGQTPSQQENNKQSTSSQCLWPRSAIFRPAPHAGPGVTTASSPGPRAARRPPSPLFGGPCALARPVFIRTSKNFGGNFIGPQVAHKRGPTPFFQQTWDMNPSVGNRGDKSIRPRSKVRGTLSAMWAPLILICNLLTGECLTLVGPLLPDADMCESSVAAAAAQFSEELPVGSLIAGTGCYEWSEPV